MRLRWEVLTGPAGEEAGQGAAGGPFAVEEGFQSGEGGAQLAGGEQMLRAARALGEGALMLGESFVDEKAAGSEGAFDAGEGMAVEILEAEDQIEGGVRQRGRGEVGFDQAEAGEALRERAERVPLRGESACRSAGSPRAAASAAARSRAAGA